MTTNMEEIIVRVVRGEAAQREAEILEDWRSASPENEKRYQELADVVGLALAARPSIASTPPTAEEIIRRADAPGAQVEPLPSWQRWASPWLRVLAAAALFVLAIFGVSEWWQFGGSGVVDVVEVRTGAGERRTAQLEDGTLVHLAEHSRMEIREDGEAPEIWLEGRAFFGVARHEDARTVIRSAAGIVTVLGTRFDMVATDESLQLLVVDGRVGIATDRDAVEVARGELGVVRAGVVESVVKVTDPLAYLDWMGRAMVFQDTPLAGAVAEIERRYGVDIEIADPEVAERTITTVFDGEPFEEVMEVICQVVDASCSVRSDGARVGL